MATRKPSAPDTSQLTPDEQKIWQLPVNPVSESHAVTDIDPDETGADRVAALLGEVSADEKARVKLQRIIGPNKYAWCKDYSVSEYEAGGLEMIRAEWGPGLYDVRLYAVHPETGRFGVRAKTMIEILQSKIEPSAAPERANSDMARALEMMSNQNAQILAALTERQANQADPMQQMSQMLTMMTAMRQAMGLDNQQRSNVSELLAGMREMREAAAEFNPPEKSDSAVSLLGQLPGILELVKVGMQNQQANRQQAAQPQDGPAAPFFAPVPASIHPQPSEAPGAPGAESNPTNNPEGEPVNIALVKMLLDFQTLLTYAANKLPADDGIELVLDRMPEEFFNELEKPDWFETLCRFAPGAAAHKEWLTLVRDGALAAPLDDTPEG